MLNMEFNISMKARAPVSRKMGEVKKRARRTACYLSAILLLSACSSDGVSDLESFVVKVKASNPGRVDPLPELKPFEKFTYSAYLEEIKDPFITWETINPNSDKNKKSKATAGTGGITPDGERAREMLEAYPLETLTMMGTLKFSEQYWGLVKAPDGIVYRVKDGNYIGQNHGRVTKIESENISLIEIVSDGLGGWKKRPVELSLNNE